MFHEAHEYTVSRFRCLSAKANNLQSGLNAIPGRSFDMILAPGNLCLELAYKWYTHTLSYKDKDMSPM